MSDEIAFQVTGPMDRPRLTGLSGLLASRRLAIVHAPAGCGKTTLLSQWRASLLRSGMRVAWLSIGDDEQDPISVAAHLIPLIQVACGLDPSSQTAFPGEGAFNSLRDLIETVCAQAPLAVMIDDYHLARQSAARQSIAALLASRHPGLVIVLASRGRPDLSLGRLRANDELIEIGNDELRFSPAEMEVFIHRAGGVPLTQAQNLFVQERTEGWAAGLRLMSLALNRSSERDAILAGTPGSRRDFADYFLEEVLEGLASSLIRFLLTVSVLEGLHVDLCNALTGDHDAAHILGELERGHLFTTPLPGQPGWYRFHHLFLEFLRARLLAEPDHGTADLHRRAAEWFIDAGRPMDAVRHAFLSQNPEWAAELIERYCVFDYLSFGRFEVYYRWMRQLPESVLASRPLLSFLLAWRYINGRRFAQAEQLLSRIEAEAGRQTAATLATSGALAVAGRLHLMRALIGAYGADLDACRRHIEAIGDQPLDDLAFGQVDLDSIGSYLALNLGDLQTTQRLTWRAFRRYEELECHWGAMHSQCIAAMAAMAAGEMSDAQGLLRQTIETGLGVFPQTSYPVALPCGLLGTVLYETGGFEEAEHLLLQAAAGDLHANTFGLAERVIIPTVALARLYDATGRSDEADTLLIRASRLAYQAEDIRLDFQLAVERADRAFRRRRFGDASAELIRVQSQVDVMRRRFPAEAWAIWQPYEILEARRLAHAGQSATAVHRLRTLGEAASRQHRHAHRPAIDALAAMLWRTMDPSGATALSDRARVRAAHLGLVRSLADIGDQGYDGSNETKVSPAKNSAFAIAPSTACTRYGLTHRERAALACLADGLSNDEISRRLAININTVKTHLKSVYSKLDVKNRAQALLVAQELFDLIQD